MLKDQLDKFREGKNIDNYDFDKDGNLKVEPLPEDRSILERGSNVYGAQD